MFGEILRDSIILFLLVYALLDICTHLVELLYDRISDKKSDGAWRVICLKPGAVNAEFLIRRAAYEVSRACPEVLLIDCGLSEEERRVAARLCQRYDFIHLYRWEQYQSLLAQQENKISNETASDTF